jgi:hypothetical protein
MKNNIEEGVAVIEQAKKLIFTRMQTKGVGEEFFEDLNPDRDE